MTRRRAGERPSHQQVRSKECNGIKTWGVERDWEACRRCHKSHCKGCRKGCLKVTRVGGSIKWRITAQALRLRSLLWHKWNPPRTNMVQSLNNMVASWETRGLIQQQRCRLLLHIRSVTHCSLSTLLFSYISFGRLGGT